MPISVCFPFSIYLGKAEVKKKSNDCVTFILILSPRTIKNEPGHAAILDSLVL